MVLRMREPLVPSVRLLPYRCASAPPRCVAGPLSAPRAVSPLPVPLDPALEMCPWSTQREALEWKMEPGRSGAGGGLEKPRGWLGLGRCG